MIAKLGKIAGFGLLFIVVLFIGLRLTFPMGLVARVVEAQAEKALDFKFDVEIDRARFSGIAGVKLSGVTISAVDNVNDEGVARLPLTLDAVRVRVAPLSVLRGSPTVRADIHHGDGRIRARYAQSGEARSIEVQLFEVALGEIRPLVQKLGVPFTGVASGTVQLEYADGWRPESGDVELSIAGLTFGPGRIRSDALRQVGGEMELKQTDFGNLILRAPIDGSDVQIQQFEASGTDIRFDATGQIQLRTPFRTSRADVNLSFQLDGEYVEEAGLGALLGMDQVRRLHVGDGYAMSIAGPLLRPSIVPGTGGGR